MTTPAQAEFAIRFSSFEYFWLACLGLSCAVVVSSGSTLKSFVSLLLGLFIATIGIDIAAGQRRFSFDSVEMMRGISFIPAMIGMFAISKVLRFIASLESQQSASQQVFKHVFRGVGSILSKYEINVARGGLIGAVVNQLPRAGSDIAAWIAFAMSKRVSRKPEKFGTGHPEDLSSMIKADGEFSGFFSQPISAKLGVIVILIWIISLIENIVAHFSKPQTA